MQDLLPKV